ncbi:MAG: FAD-dependent oxidoreductase [Planctomycetaceae bacterium]
MTQTKRIVILGGGFAGVYTAMYLEKLRRQLPGLEISIVNRENYFVFQPMLAEIVSGNIGLLDTVSPIQRLVPYSRLYVRNIESIDLSQKMVTLSPGFWPQSLTLNYDHLVIALGTVTDFRGIAGLQEHALPFKNLADAIRLRNHLIHVLNEAEIEEDEERRRQLLTFVVAGGGFSGVEVAAEMNDFLRTLARRCRRFTPNDIRVILVHSGKRILEREVGQSLSEYAQRILTKRGVELKLENRLKTATPDAAILATGDRIATKTLVSTVPSFANPLIETLDAAKENGRLLVNEYLQVSSADCVWALGDAARVPNPASGGLSPPTAQHAIRQARIVADNILASLQGNKLKSFSFPGLGKMGSLGHRSAIAELFDRIRISGFPAWFLWRTVYWWKLPGFERKLKVGLSWLLDLLVPPESVQLKTAESEGMRELHFEPGETIFQKGDLADCLYIVLSGQAEVVGEQPANEESEGPPAKRLALLGPGEYFGEIALMHGRTRSATVRCISSMDVLALSQKHFQALVTHLPDVRKSFETVMNHRIERDQANTKS